MVNDNFIYIKETDSTSTYLRKLSIERELAEGLVVYTDYQAAGRGQRGNSWQSEDGQNLLFSTILYPSFIDVSKPFILSQIVSLGIKNILDEYVDGITIKWPNDIYWRDKKICGILVENDIQGTVISKTIIGIGININQENFGEGSGNPVSMKQITLKDYNRGEILRKIIDEILLLYKASKTNPSSIICKYKEHLYRKTGYHLFGDDSGRFYAEIIDVELSGFLVLKTKQDKIRRYAFKEVRFL